MNASYVRISLAGNCYCSATVYVRGSSNSMIGGSCYNAVVEGGMFANCQVTQGSSTAVSVQGSNAVINSILIPTSGGGLTLTAASSYNLVHGVYSRSAVSDSGSNNTKTDNYTF